MAEQINLNTSTRNVDLERWKKLTAKEIIREDSRGQEIPEEILTWAQQMAAFAKIPDDITYEQVDGDVGLDALDKLNLSPEEMAQFRPEAANAQAPTATEQPDAVKDPALTEQANPETADENIFMNATPGMAADTPAQSTQDPTDAAAQTDAAETLADPALNTDLEEIRKRKLKLGLE